MPAVVVAILGLYYHYQYSHPQNAATHTPPYLAKPNGTFSLLHVTRPTSWWSLHLRLGAASRPPGKPWILREGTQPGSGYELHWLPHLLALQVFRGPDRTLLAAVRLTRMPHTVDFVRRGPWLEVRTDAAVVLTCLDPLGLPTRSGVGQVEDWSGWTGGEMGEDATVVLEVEHGDYDDHVGTTDDPELRAIGLVRDCLSGDASDQVARLGAAGAAVAALDTGSTAPTRLRRWLALALVRTALAQPGADGIARASEALAEFGPLGQQDHTPETAGMLVSLLPTLASRACDRPVLGHGDTDADGGNLFAKTLADRAQALTLLGQAALAADAQPGPFGDDQRSQLHLLIHAVGCLSASRADAMGVLPAMGADTVNVVDLSATAADASGNQAPATAIAADPASGAAAAGNQQPPAAGQDDERAHRLPMPAEAPPWLAMRWRAFAGDDPVQPASHSGFPDLPAPDGESDPRRLPITAALMTLEQAAVLEPVAGVRLRCALERLLSTPKVTAALNAPADPRARAVIADAAEQADAACDDAPPREAAITRALLALQDVVPLDKACAGLLGSPDGGDAWIDRDPLAFACADLLVHRHRAECAPTFAAHLPPDHPDDLTHHPAGLVPGRALAVYARLLAGADSPDDLGADLWQAPAPAPALGVDDGNDNASRDLLPPAEALAVALAEQEVHGGTPDYSLLSRLPCGILPLAWLAPPQRSDGIGPKDLNTPP